MKPDPRVKAIAVRIEKYHVLKVCGRLHQVYVYDAARDILAYLARRDRALLKKARKSARTQSISKGTVPK